MIIKENLKIKISILISPLDIQLSIQPGGRGKYRDVVFCVFFLI